MLKVLGEARILGTRDKVKQRERTCPQQRSLTSLEVTLVMLQCQSNVPSSLKVLTNFSVH